MNDKQLDDDILRRGLHLHQIIHNSVPGILNKKRIESSLLDLAMQDENFKTDLLRFVDVFPSLMNSDQIQSHLKDFLIKENRKFPPFFETALKAAAMGSGTELGSKFIGEIISRFAEHFIIGRDSRSALFELKRLRDSGFAFTADLLGEATLSLSEAINYQSRYLELIDGLSEAAKSWKDNEILDFNHLGAVPKANISLKVSALESRLDGLDMEGSVERLLHMILPIFHRAKKKNVFINLDLEQWSLHEIIYNLFERIAMNPEFRDWPNMGIVVQSYLMRSENDVEDLLKLSRRRKTPFTVRLVKGAYWDFETVTAKLRGLPPRVFTDKAKTDLNFESLSVKLLENFDLIHPAFAGHNHRSLLHALSVADSLKIPANAYEFQMLYGMAEPEREAFRSLKRRVRIYTPIGELLPGIGYLVRRLLENTSNQGFLRLAYKEKKDVRELMSRPAAAENITEAAKPAGQEFQNASFSDFSEASVRRRFFSAIQKTLDNPPLKVPVVIAGKEHFTQKTLKKYSPGDTNKLVGEISQATGKDIKTAVELSMKAWPAWRDTDVGERSRFLRKLAQNIRDNRAELSALMIYETGKPVREADADALEAEDFCTYYAERALFELASRKLGNLPGEDNQFFYEGRGPTAVIAPWNFPVAILCGMTAAALASGNTVLMKPSGNSSATAYALYKLILKSGFPADAVQFLPGEGGKIGAALVEDPLIAQIAFTGSKDTGLRIIEKASLTSPGQPRVKRVICEMGGKNAIIVDGDADLDLALQGVIESAFGYAGQKCSACSRVFLVGDSVYDIFTERLKEACRDIIIAPPWDLSCGLGPVIDETAYQRLMNIINNPGPGVKAIYRGDQENLPENGFYIPPAVFGIQNIKHPLMQNELFGPILSVCKTRTFEEALDAALRVEYALTGGIYSRNPKNIRLARGKFRVGNFYINRKITAAMVHRQPFGGFAMSGTGTKAGGPGYLLHFSEPRLISENTMCRGYAPEISEMDV